MKPQMNALAREAEMRRKTVRVRTRFSGIWAEGKSSEGCGRLYFGVERKKSELSRAREVALLRLGDGNGFCFLLKSSISIRFFRKGMIRGFLTQLLIYKNAGRIAIDNFAGGLAEGNKCFPEKGENISRKGHEEIHTVNKDEEGIRYCSIWNIFARRHVEGYRAG